MGHPHGCGTGALCAYPPLVVGNTASTGGQNYTVLSVEVGGQSVGRKAAILQQLSHSLHTHTALCSPLPFQFALACTRVACVCSLSSVHVVLSSLGATLALALHRNFQTEPPPQQQHHQQPPTKLTVQCMCSGSIIRTAVK